jgi:hypothetical protein
MGSINLQKVIVGGLVTAVVLIVLDYVISTYVFAPMAASMPGAMSAGLAAAMNSKRAMVGGIAMDVLFGMSIVWCYAAIRPRFGAGPMTGLCASAFVWYISALTYGTYYLFRLMSIEMFCVGAVVTLVEYLIAGYIGCRLYTEQAKT